jgi:YidC/Oxa1 family membrane protein insertase
MDRNFLLAFLLSTLAIFGYYTLFPPDEPNPENEQKVEATLETGTQGQVVKTTPVSQTTGSKSIVQAESDALRKMVSVESDLYSIEIDSRNGTLKQFYLKDYKYSMEPHFSITNFFFSLFSDDEKEEEVPYDPERLVNLAGDLSEQNRIWEVFTDTEVYDVNFQVSDEILKVSSLPEILELKAVLPNGLEEHKILTFYPDSYVIDMELKLINRTGEQKTLHPRINFGAGGEAISGESLPQPKVAVTFIDEEFDKHDGGDVENNMTFNNSTWAGLADKYFITVVKPVDGSLFTGELTPMNSKLDGKAVVIPKLTYRDEPLRLANNQEYSRKFKLYAGPKVESLMDDFDYYLSQAMDLGWFEILARPLLALLRWFQSHVVNWGVAIILLTIVVRTAMFPLAFKSMTSMRKMSQLSPKIAAIREKNKGSKEKVNQEIMKFYSQNKVNPMGGCLPMILQIPIFIALYQALLPAIELRHTSFMLFWSDLSAADYTLILPILMGATMFVQQSFTPTPTMDPTQAKIMKWMPVMMVLFFLNMPSGLVLYWVISNFISVGQQLVFNKVLPKAEISEPAKGKGKQKQIEQSKKKSGKKK